MIGFNKHSYYAYYMVLGPPPPKTSDCLRVFFSDSNNQIFLHYFRLSVREIAHEAPGSVPGD